MMTVPEVAGRIGRDPETVRRWIRSGKLKARKVGTQHLIEEADLEHVLAEDGSLPLPKAWARTWTGEPQPDWVRLLHRSRRGR
jgi:excisionase family DNA binding protein